MLVHGHDPHLSTTYLWGNQGIAYLLKHIDFPPHFLRYLLVILVYHLSSRNHFRIPTHCCGEAHSEISEVPSMSLI